MAAWIPNTRFSQGSTKTLLSKRIGPNPSTPPGIVVVSLFLYVSVLDTSDRQKR